MREFSRSNSKAFSPQTKQLFLFKYQQGLSIYQAYIRLLLPKNEEKCTKNNERRSGNPRTQPCIEKETIPMGSSQKHQNAIILEKDKRGSLLIAPFYDHRYTYNILDLAPPKFTDPPEIPRRQNL